MARGGPQIPTGPRHDAPPPQPSLLASWSRLMRSKRHRVSRTMPTQFDSRMRFARVWSHEVEGETARVFRTAQQQHGMPTKRWTR